MFVSLKEAQTRLRKNDVVALPTETVYGLAAIATSEKAIKKVFEIKKRPSSNPLIVHISQPDQLKCLVDTRLLNTIEKALMDAFWPGPLTIIMPAKKTVSPLICAGQPTVAIRMPSHPLMLKIIDGVGPIVAPSANPSGKPSPTKASHVEDDYNSSVAVLDGGECTHGLESTIIEVVDSHVVIKRLGAINAREIQSVYPSVRMHLDAEHTPGAKHRHYCPSAAIVPLGDDYVGGVIVGYEDQNYTNAKKVYILGALSDPKSIEKRLYSILRQLDLDGVKVAFLDTRIPQTIDFESIRERFDRITIKQ